MASPKGILRKSLASILLRTGLNAWCRRRNRHTLTILTYHGVREDADGAEISQWTLHMPACAFRRQVQYLKSHGYSFVTMSQALEALRAPGPGPHKLATLTFDDGFRNVVRCAYPIMRELGARGCLYVVSDLPGTGLTLWAERLTRQILTSPRDRLDLELNGKTMSFSLATPGLRQRAVALLIPAMSTLAPVQREGMLGELGAEAPDESDENSRMADWDELRSLDPKVIEVGSHSCSHPDFSQLADEAAIRHELADSKAAIEKAIGRSVLHFCYPNGWCDEQLARRVMLCGYQSAVTTRYGFNAGRQNPFQLFRIGTSFDFTEFRASASGSFELYERLHALRQQSRGRQTGPSRT